MQDITIGCDPELFLRNPNNGRIVSAHNKGKGTKSDPFPVEGGAIQVDGTALEINIRPASSMVEFTQRIESVTKALLEMNPGYELAAVPVAEFAQAYFDKLPMRAKELGCEPDFDAWTGEVNSPPDMMLPMRTGAGHIHVGWTEGKDPHEPQHYLDCCVVAKQLDYYLGVNSLLWDPDDRRRSMYGKAGCFRPKPYGVEYRVLSNAWLRSLELQRWVYIASRKAMKDFMDGKVAANKWGDLAQDLINNNCRDWEDWSGDLETIVLPRSMRVA